MTTETTNTTEAARALKVRHRAMWAVGDYPAVVTDHGAAHPRHVIVRRDADPVTSGPGVKPAGRPGRSPTG